MSSSGEKNDWRWPDLGLNAEEIEQEIRKILSPYEKDLRPICYPGTPIEIPECINGLLAKQINQIGSHAHLRPGEGGFEGTQRMEALAIRMVASVLGATEPDQIEGYFCGGGTEANLEGLWVGREYLRKCPDPYDKGIVVLSTCLRHYSIDKAVNLLDIGRSNMLRCTKCGEDHLFMPDVTGCGLNLVGMDHSGQMSIEDLERVFCLKYEEGFRRFLVVPTVGTCAMGSIDPIDRIGEFIRANEQKTGAHFYMHVDASFAGFTVPFVAPELKIWFQVPEVKSITLDADKMGRLPYPSGIYLCRKDLMQYVNRKVNYVRGNEDCTVSGSRSCLAPVMAYYLYRAGGLKKQREYVQERIDERDRLVELIKERRAKGSNLINLFPRSPYVNFAPMFINIYKGHIPRNLLEETNNDDPKLDEVEKVDLMDWQGRLEAYHLRSDTVPEDPIDPNSCTKTVYKVVIMSHTLGKNPQGKDRIEQFVDDLEAAHKFWVEKHKEK